jgi:hypothetical protein
MINMMDEIVDTVIEKFTPLIHRVAKKSLHTGRVLTESRTQDSFVTFFLSTHKFRKDLYNVSIQKEYNKNILIIQ